MNNSDLTVVQSNVAALIEHLSKIDKALVDDIHGQYKRLAIKQSIYRNGDDYPMHYDYSSYKTMWESIILVESRCPITASVLPHPIRKSSIMHTKVTSGDNDVQYRIKSCVVRYIAWLYQVLHHGRDGFYLAKVKKPEPVKEDKGPTISDYIEEKAANYTYCMLTEFDDFLEDEFTPRPDWWTPVTEREARKQFKLNFKALYE